jgi:hypothetical protein
MGYEIRAVGSPSQGNFLVRCKQLASAPVYAALPPPQYPVPANVPPPAAPTRPRESGEWPPSADAARVIHPWRGGAPVAPDGAPASSAATETSGKGTADMDFGY